MYKLVKQLGNCIDWREHWVVEWTMPHLGTWVNSHLHSVSGSMEEALKIVRDLQVDMPAVMTSDVPKLVYRIRNVGTDQTIVL